MTRSIRRGRSAARRPTAILTLLLTTLLLLTPTLRPAAAQSSSPAPDAADERTRFTVGTMADLSSTNPFKSTSTTMDYEYLFLAYDMLLNFSRDDLSPIPNIAESWTTSEDGKTWTFKIRDDATWSDGEPLTAHDVAFTFNFMLENQGTGTFNNYLGDAKRFSAPDDTTFVWEMNTPTLAPVTPPYIPILPEHIWKNLDGEDAETLKSYRVFPPVGSGPYELVEWKDGEFLRFEARPDYFGGTPAADEVIFRVYENQEALVQALKTGEVDAINDITPTLFDSLTNEPGITTKESAPSQVINLAFNLKQGAAITGDGQSTAHPALQDVVVRRAIAHSIDKKALVDTLLQGYGREADSFILPSFKRWYLPAAPDEQYPFDIAKANQMLDDAGYLDTDGDGIREMPGGGEPLEFDLYTLTDTAYSTDAGKLVKGWMEQTGWDVTLLPVTSQKLTQVWSDSDYDGYIWYWTGDPDPDFMLSIFTTDQCGVWSDTCYSDPGYDQLYLDQKVELDPAKRKAIVDQMQQQFFAEVPEVMLFYTEQLQAFRDDRWTGFVASPSDGSYIYAWGPWSYLEMRPASTGSASATPDSGDGLPAIVWFLAAGVIVVLAAVIIGRARRKGDEDRA